MYLRRGGSKLSSHQLYTYGRSHRAVKDPSDDRDEFDQRGL